MDHRDPTDPDRIRIQIRNIVQNTQNFPVLNTNSF